MPGKDEHLKKAEGNEKLALSLTHETQPKIEWTLVILFYAAVHYVEAYLATMNQHTRSHQTRDSWLAKEAVLKSVYVAFQHLKYFGYNSRYEVTAFTVMQTQEATSDLAALKSVLLGKIKPSPTPAVVSAKINGKCTKIP